MPQNVRAKITLRRWLEYLAAILIGNAIYFFSLYPHLPQEWRHNLYHVDRGCFLILSSVQPSIVYGLMRLASRL